MNRYLDCIQIWYGCSLGISDDLINFGMKPLKTKWLPQLFKKKAAYKACGHRNLWAVAWIGMFVL